ncbi:MAG: toll/interleukin-1 receptor domain-containing protein [Candidatus Gracilibacteria bacterium]
MKVFISYSSKDRKIIREIYEYIKDDFEVWLDEKSLLSGEEFEREISLELSQCVIYLLIVSKNFWKSTFIYEKELPSIFQQVKLGKFIVPFILDDIASLEDPRGNYYLNNSISYINSLPRCKDGHIISYSDLLEKESDKNSILEKLKYELKKLPFSYTYFRFTLESLKMLHYESNINFIADIKIDDLEVRYIENNKVEKKREYQVDSLYDEYIYETFRENKKFIEIKNKIFREKEITKSYLENKFGSYLFPAPNMIMKNKIKTSSYEKLKAELNDAQLFHIIAKAGVGKSSAMTLLKQDLKNSNHIVILYDVFGSGYYKENKRYKKNNFLKQVINEIAVLNGLEPIDDSLIDLEIKLKEYLNKLHSWEKKITIIIDAADNAVSASKDSNERECFVSEFLRYEFPSNTKIIVTSRDGIRKERINAPKEAKVLELVPFSYEDTLKFLTYHNIELNDGDQNKFYSLTKGVGRVCEYAISNINSFLNNNKVADINSIFAMIYDKATQNFLSKESKYLEILVLMYRGITLKDFLNVTGLSEEKAKSIINTLSPGIEIQNGNLIFKDEDFEKFLDDKIKNKTKIHKKIAKRILEIDSEYSHRALGYHLANANMYAELVRSVFSDFRYDNQMLKQEIQQERIQLAVNIAFEKKDYFTISKLFIKAIELKKSQRNINDFLIDNPELVVINTSKSYATEFLYKDQKTNPLYFYRLAYLIVSENKEKSKQFINQAEEALYESLKNNEQNVDVKDISYRLMALYHLYGDSILLEKKFRLWFRLKIIQNLPQKFLRNLIISRDIFNRLTKIEQIVFAFYAYKAGNKEFYRRIYAQKCNFVDIDFFQNNCLEIVELLLLENNQTIANKLINNYKPKDFKELYSFFEVKDYEDTIFWYALNLQEINLEQFNDKKSMQKILKELYKSDLSYSKCLLGQFSNKTNIIEDWNSLYDSIDSWDEYYIKEFEKDYIKNIKLLILLKIAVKFLDEEFVDKSINKILVQTNFNGIKILNFLIQENLLSKSLIVVEKYIKNIELLENDLQSKIESLIECAKVITLFDENLAKEVYKKAYTLSSGINDLIYHNFEIIDACTKKTRIKNKSEEKIISTLLASIEPIDQIRYKFKPWYIVNKIASNLSISSALGTNIFLDTRAIYNIEDSLINSLSKLKISDSEKIAFRYILNENSHLLLEQCEKEYEVKKVFKFIRKNYTDDKQFEVLSKYKGKYNFIDKYLEFYLSNNKVKFEKNKSTDFSSVKINEENFDDVFNKFDYFEKKSFWEHVYKNNLVSKRFLALKLSKSNELASAYQIFFDCLEEYSKDEQEKLCEETIKNNAYYLQIKNWSGLKPKLFYKYINEKKVLNILIEHNLDLFSEDLLLETLSYQVELLSKLLSKKEKKEIIELNLEIIKKDIIIKKEKVNLISTVEDFLWKLLCHPDKRKRWQAMHTLKELIVINSSQYLCVIDNIFQNRPDEDKYSLNFSGVWHLLMVLHKISFEQPIILSVIENKLYEFIQKTEHILFKRISKEILLHMNYEKYKDELKFIAIAKSSKIQCKYFQKEEFFSDLMRNHWDTIHYWYTNITSIFDIEMKEVINIADKYLKQWQISINDMNYKEFKINSFDRDTYLLTDNRHGSLPTIEELPNYLEFHLMFFIVNELIDKYSVFVDRYDDGDLEKFEEWISRFYINKKDWISETRDEKPQIDLLFTNYDYENIDLKELVQDKENFLLSCSVNNISRDKCVHVEIDSILVDKKIGQEIANYFNSFKSHYEYSFPDDGGKFSQEIFTKIFKINQNSSEIENDDIFKRMIYHEFKSKFDLEFIQYSDRESEYESYNYGHIVKTSQTKLKKILKTENKNIMFEIILRISKENDSSNVQKHYVYLLKQGEL